MEADELARWLQERLVNTGAWYTVPSTVVDKSEFDLEVGSTHAVVSVELVR